MEVAKRNEEIRKMRRPRFTLRQIGNKFGITSERVRQILLRMRRKYEQCRRHGVLYFGTCRHCINEKSYKKKLRDMGPEIKAEIARLAVKGRTGEMVQERNLLIQHLVEKKGFSFSRVAQLLHRSHSTISKTYKRFGARRLRGSTAQ